MADSSSDSKYLEVRDARDRMIDLLGLGETYPLRDVAVSEELKVPFNKSATVRIAPTQQGVGYQLRDVNGDRRGRSTARSRAWWTASRSRSPRRGPAPRSS